MMITVDGVVLRILTNILSTFEWDKTFKTEYGMYIYNFKGFFQLFPIMEWINISFHKI